MFDEIVEFMTGVEMDVGFWCGLEGGIVGGSGEVGADFGR